MRNAYLPKIFQFLTMFSLTYMMIYMYFQKLHPVAQLPAYNVYQYSQAVFVQA